MPRLKDVTVYIPWSADLDAHRRAALFHVAAALPGLLPGARIVLAEAAPDGEFDRDVPDMERLVFAMPWNKGRLMNRAILEHCATPWAMMLDSDLLLGVGVAEAIARNLKKCHLFVPFSRVEKLDQGETARLLAGETPPPASRPRVNVPFGGAFVVRRDVFLAMRGFDERFAYMEDTDLGHRFRGAGEYRMASHGAPALHLWHPPADYPTAACCAMFSRRKHMSFRAAVRDTESCIPNPS